MQREGFREVSNVKDDSLPSLGITHTEQEPLLMALSVGVNVQVQVIFALGDEFSSLEVAAFEE